MLKFNAHYFSLCSLISLVLVGMSSCKAVKHPNVIGTKDTLLSYVMAGQSNMAGRGTIEQIDIVPDKRLLMLDTNNTFVLAKEPLDFYEPSIAGLSCGHAFGEQMLSALDPEVHIGLIPCAIGSTSIEEWLGDSTHIIKLYTTMLMRAKDALVNGRLKGVLWQQGETNADYDSTSIGYAGKLQAFILKFRNDIGDNHLPFFIAKLGSWCDKPYRDRINQGIDTVAKSIPNIYVIETSDLSHKPDNLHYDSAGFRKLGERMALYARALL